MGLVRTNITLPVGPRSLADAIIAGVAWFLDATVVTRDPRDFEVQGVRVIGYG